VRSTQFLFFGNLPFHEKRNTVAPDCSAIATVRSVLPESTTTTSANYRTRPKHVERFRSSFFTGITTVTRSDASVSRDDSVIVLSDAKDAQR